MRFKEPFSFDFFCFLFFELVKLLENREGQAQILEHTMKTQICNSTAHLCEEILETHVPRGALCPLRQASTF